MITAEVNQGILGPLFGDKLLLVAHGYVIAGVDLAHLSVSDLRLEDDVLYVHLPEAEVLLLHLIMKIHTSMIAQRDCCVKAMLVLKLQHDELPNRKSITGQ